MDGLTGLINPEIEGENSLVDIGHVFDAAGEDILEFLFDVTFDAGYGFGSQALVTLVGDFGASYDDLFLLGAFDGDATLVISLVEPTTVIPLPATALMLLAGVGALVLRSRRRT